MKQFILITTILFACISVSASKIDYKITPTTNGFLCFIMPFEVPSEVPNSKPIIADLTILSSSDSVNCHITILSPDELQIDSIGIKTDNGTATYKSIPMYIEKERKKWKYRILIKMSYQELTSMYIHETAYRISIIQPDNTTMYYSYTHRQWKKISGEMRDIFHLIKLNKR